MYSEDSMNANHYYHYYSHFANKGKVSNLPKSCKLKPTQTASFYPFSTASSSKGNKKDKVEEMLVKAKIDFSRVTAYNSRKRGRDWITLFFSNLRNFWGGSWKKTFLPPRIIDLLPAESVGHSCLALRQQSLPPPQFIKLSSMSPFYSVQSFISRWNKAVKFCKTVVIYFLIVELTRAL